MSGILPPRIAVLMTCHNRRNETIACLETLLRQQYFTPGDLFLVDDGSEDGTGDAVRAMIPDAQVLDGDGTLFWNGGMRRAWQAAKEAPRTYDFYLWLNDDVTLFENALAMLVADADATAPRGCPVIVAGATCAPGDRGTITYGAQYRPDPARRFRLRLLVPNGAPREAVSMSGNVVLVSAAAEQLLGNLSAELTHIYGDLDYGMRAVAAGVPVVLASGIAGQCAANDDDAGSSRDSALPRRKRIARLWKERKGVHSRDWRRFVARHCGPIERLRHKFAPYWHALRK